MCWEWHGAVDLGIWAGGYRLVPPYGSSPAAEQDSLRSHRMVVRRLDHTRDQKGCDNTGDNEDSWWWQENAPQATHLPHSF